MGIILTVPEPVPTFPDPTLATPSLATPDRLLRPVLSRLEAWPRGVVAALSVALVGVLSLADLATGSEISSSVFYSVPVALAAWYAGRGWGLTLCGLAAFAWYEADVLAGANYSAAWIPVWNAGVRFLFFVIIAGLLVRLREALEAQRRLAEVDPLTGLANTRRFRAAVDAEIVRAARYRHPVSLAYVDLDDFKAVNDRWGHDAGDAALREVARALRVNLRMTDLPARMGGDEFAVLFPETGAAAAHEAVGKLRSALETAVRDREWPVGFSMGVVTSGGGLSSGEELIREADALMYQVKQSGKGRSAYGTLEAPLPRDSR